MTQEEWEEFTFINEQLEYMQQQGLIENLRIEEGDSILTSYVKFDVKEEMLPLLMKSDDPTIH